MSSRSMQKICEMRMHLVSSSRPVAGAWCSKPYSLRVGGVKTGSRGWPGLGPEALPLVRELEPWRRTPLKLKGTEINDMRN
jgi:hypothetical protein